MKVTPWPTASPCTGTFQVTIPNDPTLCGTFVLDRVDIELLYTRFPAAVDRGRVRHGGHAHRVPGEHLDHQDGR